MKRLALIAALLVAGCESETEFGRCVGVAPDSDIGPARNPDLKYDLSIWNVFWGVVGIEMIFPPLLVLHHEVFCPVGYKTAPLPKAVR